MIFKPLFFVLLLSILACKQQPSINVKALNNGEAKAVINIDGRDFYSNESIFTGEVFVFPTLVRINITDQYKGNIVISVDKPSLHDHHPIHEKITTDNLSMISVLIGKLYDNKQTKGEGYIMGNGDIYIDEMNENEMKINIKGKVGNYITFGDSTTWKKINGTIIIKSPNYQMTNIEAENVFFN